MRTIDIRASLKAAVRAVSILPFAAVVAFGQQQINLAAGPTTATLPDGTVVPMWGYSCGAVVAGSAAACAKLNPAATGWSPVVITVPTGQSLQINLTNNLTFGANSVPTSMVIVGQLGGGLGAVSQRTTTPSPDHTNAQGTVTWPAAGDPGLSTPLVAQGPRVQSFSTEVAAGATTSLTWTTPRAGTYLIESGTHPSIQGPMGLYGMLVVTTRSSVGIANVAYPGVNYAGDVPLLLSEIDPVQNNYVNTAVNTTGFSETAVWNGQTGECGDPAVHTCYPPAVNYSALYYLFNGVAFNKTNAAASRFAPAATIPLPATGRVLVRMVNAGLRMHVPSIVGSQIGTPAVSGFSLIAEDGNPLPGVARVQSEVFLAAGKTYDVMINVPAAGGTALPVYDRQLSLSANATARDAGMLAYISINGAALPAAGAIAPAAAVNDTYNSIVPGQALTVSDPARGVIANDTNVYGVKVVGSVTGGSVALSTNGTFTFTPTATSGSFQYCGNGTASGAACATVTLGAAPAELPSGITVNGDSYTSKLSTTLSIKAPGVLGNDTDTAGYPLKVNTPLASVDGGLSISVDPNGGFTASVGAPGTYHFSYQAKSARGTVSAGTAVVTLIFPQPSNLQVTLVDGKSKSALSPQDYRWIIEEDRTFYVDPNNTTNTTSGVVPTFGVNFHTSYMPVVAQGCTGTISCEDGQTVLDTATGNHVSAVCDIGNGGCRPGTTKTPVLPSQAVLDPTKRYYISVLPGDAVDPGHAMGGAQIAAVNGAFPAVTVIVEPTPLPPAKVSVFVFQDDHPLNGEHDAGGGIDALSPNEAGLGQFNITLFDDAGGTGDPTGQMTYDMFNMPLSNSLAGTKDPVNGNDACPISKNALTGIDTDTGNPAASQTGITGVITVCPKYESDGITLSPLAGQAVVVNLPPGRYGVVATPGADRIARGEEWLQTNTLDGGAAHDSFLKVSEPSYFQEFGPAGYHVAIGFANPSIINGRKPSICTGAGAPACTSTLKGNVSGVHMSRTPDQRLYGTGTYDTYGYSQCYVSVGSPDGGDFAFQKCAPDGTFSFANMPAGDWRVTIFDQWNDQVVDGISTPIRVGAGTVDMGEISLHQWKQNISTRTFFDTNGDGVSQETEAGLSLVPTNVRFRDGSFSNFNSTDLQGFAGFNEVFPLFNWYVIETDALRYKNTGTHVVYDAGGPVDGTAVCGTAGYPACGTSTIGQNMARTKEDVPLPTALRVPGARYCANADCPPGDTAGGSTGRVDPPWVTTYGWQGFAGQNSFLEFGKKPFMAGENGGIKGHVVYASTRPFDDPALLLQLSWEPMVPNVTINLYQTGAAPDGSQSLKLVDTTKTSSWDDWAQGFRAPGVPNMNCPGQSTADPFYFTLLNQPNYLNASTPLPNGSQFKCYDGMHNWVQLQPAPYDGMYQFPSVTARNLTTGAPTGTNCTICVANPSGDGTRMLPAGKYVVEVVVPPGYELVKEEDKNILLGDSYVAPVVQQFAGLGSIFIMPDQAAVAAHYNPTNPLNSTTDLGALPRHEGDTGTVEVFWPCVGAERIVPDFMSLFPHAGQNAPFAGATRKLCDRKEVILDDQSSSLVKFYVFTSTHVAGHFTGVITDDFTSEFDPFAPDFGEKFAPSNLPISVKDWAGNEVSRVYSDHWGLYNGLNYSTYGVNPPAPTGYVPQMMVMCMNDRGSGVTPDPLFQAGYSQFCYELPFMPGQTGYFDTPVVPTSAFSEGYNHPDCDYPNATPAISQVNGDGIGPWVSAAGNTLTITALGDQMVNNYGYSGPVATTAPFNQKTVLRHYGFGATQGSGKVTIGGITATVTNWSDTQITVTVPPGNTATGNNPANGVAQCAIQQRNVPSGTTTQYCGELVITAGNGLQSIDTVTVTIGGKAPIPVTTTIQSAIDNAAPGDLIMVPPGNYRELLLMWKPVRLQGVGAASSIIDGSTHPAGSDRLDPWRRQVVCLFGLALNGLPISGTNPYDVPTDTSNNGGPFVCPSNMQFQVDRLPLEATVGWDATLNGNLAEQLQEPTLMGAYEGAAITVLAKGVRFPAGSNPFAADTFPALTRHLTNSTADCNDYPSNFQCNPSRIDGLSITNSSQGGGGVFVHGWGHNLEIANNRIHNNQGTLSGGISIGQGEHPDALLQGAANAEPGSCQSGGLPNTQLPYCFDTKVNVHHNSVTLNSSEGDELFSATPAGAGGVTFCTGADFYKFNFNWVCGNLSTGDGGGVAHLGFAWNGAMEHNSILFNQSTNPTVPTNGGGIVIMGGPDTDPVCPGEPDADCAPGMGDGIGPNLVINANLIMGNAAESGSGGGLRLQGVNGTDVTTFPLLATQWYSVNVTNNIITNNVAGWDGAGVSLNDALSVNLVNNTIVSNDATASSGALFNAFFAPLASSPSPTGPTCNGLNCSTSLPQVAGVVSTPNSPDLIANLPGTVICPLGHANGLNIINGACRQFSYPLLYNNVIFQNRTFHLDVAALSPEFQQAVVTLVPALNQPSTGATQANGGGVVISGGTGACVTGASYWDIGVRGDTGPTDHSGSGGIVLAPQSTVLTSLAGGYTGNHNSTSNPTVVSQYCNGSRIPPEFGGMGYRVPPGTNEGSVPTPVFNLTAGATVDEGNNWVNIKWGPLAATNPVSGARLGDYTLAAGSPSINYITLLNSPITYLLAPSTDFFGNPRRTAADPGVDAGAVEFRTTVAAPTLASIAPTSGVRGTAVPVTLTGTNLTGATAVNVSGAGITVSAVTVVNATTVTATFTISGTAALTARNVTVTTPGGTSGNVTFTVVAAPVPTLTSIAPNTGVRGTAVPVTLTGTNLTGTAVITVSGTGVTPSAITVVNSTTVTATFTITAGATLSARNVSVTTPGGTSNNVTFTVQALTPTLASIAPASGVRGTAVPVTLTGTNLTGATAVNVSGSGVTVSGVTVVNATTVTATFTMTAGATLSVRNVSVTTPNGTSNTVTFTVQGATLASIAPTSGARGAAVPVTLTGTNLTGATAVTVSGGNVTVSGVTVVNATTVTATFTIGAGATGGARNVAVVTPIGTTNSVTFTVLGPNLTSIAPNTGRRGTAVPVTLTGNGLTGTTAVTVSGTGVAVSAVTVVNDTTVTATFTIAGGTTAALTGRTVSVTTPAGTSNTVTFTVTGATLASIAPNTGVRGATGASVPVTLTGVGLTGATAINVSGTGVTATAPTVVNDTTVTTTLTITAGATLGGHNVAAVTPIGTTNNVTFTVNP